MSLIRIGSRGSDLALWQANHVRKQLENLGHTVEITVIKGKGFFTKEIEEALLNNTIDLAVHSHKDLETTPPEDLVIACVSEREDPSDLLLIRKDRVDHSNKWGLPLNAIVGTSSARRKALMSFHRPDVVLNDLRGNVPTRIQRLADKSYDAIILAKAGVDRLELDLSAFYTVVLDPKEFVPAPAQGVLGLQIRSSDQRMSEALQPMHHPDIAARIAIERGVLNKLEGGCQLPLGVYCDESGNVHVAYGKAPGSMQFLHERVNQLNDPVQEIIDKLG